MYSTITDILQTKKREHIIDLVNDENRPYNEIDLDDETDICSVRINDAIRKADEEIKPYLLTRYKLPLSSVPERVKDISSGIAYANLYQRRHDFEMPDGLLNNLKSLRNDLNRIAKGEINLGIEVVNSNPNSVQFKSNKTLNDKQFTKDILDNY